LFLISEAVKVPFLHLQPVGNKENLPRPVPAFPQGVIIAEFPESVFLELP
jgi:hypothetical protein